MFSFFFSLFIYRRFVCGYPWCVSYPALPSGCRNIVFLRNCGLRLKFHHLSPCFKRILFLLLFFFSLFTYSYSHFFLFSFVLFFFFALSPIPFVPLSLLSHSSNKVSRSSPRFYRSKRYDYEVYSLCHRFFFFFEVSKTGRLFARLYRIKKKKLH